MATTTATPAREIKIRAPPEFIGEREKVEQFLQDVGLYLRINPTQYDDDEKRILFALSFMTGGTAAAWKSSFVKRALAINPANFGTYANFETEVKTAFSPVQAAESARIKLRNLKQEKSLDDYIAKFRIYSAQSGLIGDVILIEYFMQGLHPRLLDRILGMDTVPTTLDDWFAKAAKFDANYHRAKAISGRIRASFTERKSDHIPVYRAPPPPARDPMAMDVDRLTTQQREDHYKRGLCFECHLPGHRASDHKKQRNSPSSSSQPRRFPPRNATPKGDGFSRIRAIVNELPDDEREKTLNQLETEGF
jgi:retrotransposon gag protein